MQQKMRCNTKKTKLILFNPDWAKDFIPQFSVDGNEIELAEEISSWGWSSAMTKLGHPTLTLRQQDLRHKSE